MTEQDLALLSDPIMIAALVSLVIVEFGLLIWGVIDWVKRPAEQVRGNKVVWLLVMVFLNIIGPVLYLTVGRLPKPAVDTASPVATGDRAVRAADALYGSGGAPAVAPPAGVPAPQQAPSPYGDDPEIGADGTASGELP